MRRLQNKYVNEFFDKTQAKAKQHHREMLFIAFIPTLIITAYTFYINSPMSESKIILMPLLSIFFYVLSYGSTILAVDCWSIAEMVSPRVQGRYRKVRTFFSLLTDAPTRQEFLRATKLYSDVVEKNGIENYLSLSEFMKKFYDGQEKQNRKIDETLAEVMRQLGINRLAFEKEHNLRVEAEGKRDKEKQKNQKLTRLIITLSKTIIKLREIIKKLKGE
jgi:hypothetical protein